jgi:hypothetical protein
MSSQPYTLSAAHLAALPPHLAPSGGYSITHVPPDGSTPFTVFTVVWHLATPTRPSIEASPGRQFILLWVGHERTPSPDYVRRAVVTWYESR